MVIAVCIVYDCIHATREELSSCNRDHHMATKPGILILCPFSIKVCELLH